MNGKRTNSLDKFLKYNRLTAFGGGYTAPARSAVAGPAGMCQLPQYARQIARQRNVVEALHEPYQVARARLSLLEDASV